MAFRSCYKKMDEVVVRVSCYDFVVMTLTMVLCYNQKTMYRFLLCFFVLLSSSCTQTLQPFKISRGCPEVRFVSQAEMLVRWLSDSCVDGICSLDKMISRATLADFEGTCSYKREDLLEVTLNVVIIAQKGNASMSREEIYTYTLAIIAPDDQILGQRHFSTSFTFQEDTDISAVQEQLVQHIPLSPEAKGKDYKILLGFTLNPEQWKYNQEISEQRRR